ncbi:MAG: S49 family peptidase [Rhizobiales bacterium]|nr:S49 family peptidase [Hyphomicrobiales bacterium]
MAKQSFLARFIPLRFRKSVPVIHHVRLHGAIGVGTPLRAAITAKDSEEVLDRAFSRKGIAGVALSINSPGGSAVQAALIHKRIRALAEKHKIPVYAFCEDVAASGGYWIACAADEIYADDSSIVGSIGVIAAGFGFVDAIEKLGIERRVHTAGDNKAILDPFQPEKKEDVKRLLALQADVHESFKSLVRARRAGKLTGEEKELFSGAFWTGRQALELGLIDGIGHLHDVLQRKFGDKVVVRTISPASGWGLKRLGFGTDVAGSVMEAMEARALWARFGL